MPISEDDKREAAKDRATVATGKQLKDTYDLIAALREQLKGMKVVDEEYKELDKLIEKVEKSKLRLIKTLKEEIAEMEKEERTINRIIAAHKKSADMVGKFIGQFKSGLQTLNTYALDLQEIIDLSGQFSGKLDQGLKSFENMRRELNLTRKEMADFGKVASELGRRGIDIDQLTKSASNLQKVFGQQGGLTKLKELAELKVAPNELKKILEKRDIGAMIKASGQANVSLKETYAMSGLTGATKGQDAAAAARFERAGAKVGRMAEDVEANIAAGVQMGIGPEFAGMVVPLTEINMNVAKIIESNKGFVSWIKSTLPSLFGSGAGAAAGKVAAGGTTAAPAATASLWSRMGTAIGSKWAAAKGLTSAGVTKAATMAGPNVIQAAKTGGKGLGVGLGFTAAGYGMDMLADQIEEDAESFWKTLGREGLKSLGKASKVAGTAISSAALGATAGTVAGGPAGTAVGSALGGVAGLSTEYETQYGAGAVAREEEEKEARDRVRRAKEIQEKKEQQEREVLGAMNEYKTTVDSMVGDFQRTSEAISQMPEVIEAGVAQSRLAQVQESGDSKAMHEYADKMSKSFQVATSAAGELRDKQMADAEKGAQEMERRAKLERQKDPFSGQAEHYEKIAKNFRTEQERANIRYQEEVKKHSLVGAAEGAMGGYETGKGQRARELQAATAEFETEFGGTGNVEEMKKIQEKTNAVNKANRDQLVDANSIAVAKYTEQLNLYKKDIVSKNLKGKDLEQAQYEVGLMENKLKEQKRIYDIGEKTLKQENQNYNIQQSIAQAMAATETVEFKRSQRQAALAKAQESFARERGAAPGEVGAYAGAQAQEAQTQLSAFMDTFTDRMGDLQQQLNAQGVTGPQRMAIEMRIKDLADERVKLESQSLQSRIHAATAEEKQNQELIGISKRVADIQRDTAAKMGMSWQVQMKYQSESIKLSRAEIDSMTTEIAKMTEEIASTPGADPERQLQLQQRKADLAQKQADMIGNVLGKQRTFMESQVANAFGVGGGTKVSPLVNQRLFGPQVQNQLGQRQAAGMGGVMTFEQQQAKRLQDAGMGILGGIGGGVPGPGNAPGLPPGVAIPGKPVAGGVGANGAAGAQGAQQGAGGLDISGKIEIGLNDNLLETRVIRIVQRNFGLQGGT